MEELLTVIGNVGFPIAVSAFLLIRIEKQLKSLDQSIQNLTLAINEMK